MDSGRMVSGDVTFETIDARDPIAVAAMSAYFAELDERFVDGFDPGDTLTADASHFDPPTGAFVVGRIIGEGQGGVVGCGGLQRLSAGVGEIKRMWIAPSWRGRGIAGALLRDLESRARSAGYATVRLDTNATLVEAIAMYRRHGYAAIDRYNDNPYAQHWFEKSIARMGGHGA
jgi:GNAT superfamily N-acetyltransferase